jgi:hypothetical protein
MNYKLIVKQGQPTNILETATGQIVYTSNEKDARVFMRRLNLGNGFDGWTPTFFLKTFKINQNYV